MSRTLPDFPSLLKRPGGAKAQVAHLAGDGPGLLFFGALKRGRDALELVALDGRGAEGFELLR